MMMMMMTMTMMMMITRMMIVQVRAGQGSRFRSSERFGVARNAAAFRAARLGKARLVG
jgi:hypothetical protein